MRLLDKVALIAGAGRGIGRAIAAKFAEEGALVALAEKDVSFARTVAQQIDEEGERTLAVGADVCRSEEVREMVGRVERRFGGIDVLVNCAAVRQDFPFDGFSEAAWDGILETNLKGSLRLVQAVQPSMVSRCDGRIVLFSAPFPPGVAGRGQAPYQAAGAGIEGLTRSLAVELGPFNIRINCIAPDCIDTVMTREAARAAGMYLDDFRKLVLALVPLRRMGTAEEVADLALFLASDASAFVTGQIIGIKGGP
ncbi:MAG: SDR family oxidoreductase [Deltaproteobacteria bacterium]|nr:SDR family oxidoreductase [Deltaproteobacteria bacterium]